jgi:serine/threonine protein phosphatase 1
VPFQADDIIITLGDYVNRGPESSAVIDWLIACHKRGQLIALRGNHEIMMLDARSSDEAFNRWIECGGDATLTSYSHFGDKGSLVDISDTHWHFLEEHTRAWYETSTHFFVHANAYPDYPLEEQPDFMLFWEQFDHSSPHVSGKVMVCGHTSQKAGLPLNLGHAVCIDTWACGKGWLTCLDAASGRYWQSNQQGQSRMGWIDELLNSES